MQCQQHVIYLSADPTTYVECDHTNDAGAAHTDARSPTLIGSVFAPRAARRKISNALRSNFSGGTLYRVIREEDPRRRRTLAAGDPRRRRGLSIGELNQTSSAQRAASIRTAASARSSSTTWVYRFAVRCSVHPMSDMTVRESTPITSSSVAAVCRASCNRFSGTPAAVSSVFHAPQSRRGSTGRPHSLAKTRSLSCQRSPARSRS